MECFRLPYVSGMSVLHTPPSTKNTANMAFHPMFLGRTYGCPTTIVCTILFKKNSSRLCTVSSFVLRQIVSLISQIDPAERLAFSNFSLRTVGSS
jgi:hypothetical protein